MWQLYLTAEATRSRPSDLLCIEDRWAALQFDNAITFFGSVTKGALQEMKEVGSGNNKRYEPKYKLSQLLDQNFRLPTSKRSQTGGASDLASLLKGSKRGP